MPTAMRPSYGAPTGSDARPHPVGCDSEAGRIVPVVDACTGPALDVLERPRGRRGAPPGPAMGRARLERPDQPDELRHVRVPEAVRVQPREGHRADARRPPQGPRRGLQRLTASRPRSTCSGSTSTACGPRCSRTTEPARAARPTVERGTGGGFSLNLGADERTLVARLLDELRDAARRAAIQPDCASRLFPVAHPDDAEHEAEYQRLMREELVARFAGITRVDAVLGGRAARCPLDEAELMAFMQAVNGCGSCSARCSTSPRTTTASRPTSPTTRRAPPLRLPVLAARSRRVGRLSAGVIRSAAAAGSDGPWKGTRGGC